MSHKPTTVSEAVERLSRRDTFRYIDLRRKQLTDAQLAELADCLLAHPDCVREVLLGYNQLTDETGVKLARYLAASSTIEFLDLSFNQFGSATYLAVAAALRVNTSLQGLYLFNNQAVDRTLIDAAFVEALRVNLDHPAKLSWHLYSSENEFKRLFALARLAGPMSSAAASPAAQSSTDADERVRQLEQQLREQEQAAAAVQASLEATTHELRKYRRKSKKRKDQLKSSQSRAQQEKRAKRAAQAQLAERTAEVQRLQHDNAALQALLAASKSASS